jgi:hypothetical protein
MTPGGNMSEQAYADLQTAHSLNAQEMAYVKAELEYRFAASGPSMDYGLSLDRGIASKRLEATHERLTELNRIVQDVVSPDDMRPVCECCYQPDAFDWYVPDTVWDSIVPEYATDSVVCLRCFDNFAAIKNINYTIDTLYFAGRQMTFKFQCSSRVDRYGRGE